MSEQLVPDRSDRLALNASVGIAAIGAVITVVSTVARLREVAAGRDIPVIVMLPETSVGLPLGPSGADVTASVDTATILVNDPAPATLFALWAEPIWLALAVLAGLWIASVFFLRIARGEIFTRGGSRLALAGGLVFAAGWAGSMLFSTMSANGALAAISDGTYDQISMYVPLTPVLVILFIGGLGSALQIGEKLQRDTVGLV
jgi:hypothetical protein